MVCGHAIFLLMVTDRVKTVTVDVRATDFHHAKSDKSFLGKLISPTGAAIGSPAPLLSFLQLH